MAGGLRGVLSLLGIGDDLPFGLAPVDIARDEVEGLIGEAFQSAMDMCGNEGQISIIEGMEDVFRDAGWAAAAGQDALSVLASGCFYPEAVMDILSEAAGILDEAGQIMGEGLAQVGDG